MTLLAGMNQGTRRKIRTAIKEGVTVRPANSAADLQTLYDLYRSPGERQGFSDPPAGLLPRSVGAFYGGRAGAGVPGRMGRARVGGVGAVPLRPEGVVFLRHERQRRARPDAHLPAAMGSDPLGQSARLRDL